MIKRPTVIIATIILLLFLVPNWMQPQIHALNAFLDPNSDGSTASWSSTAANYFSTVDEAIRQPTTPNTSDYISGEAGKSGTIFLRLSEVTAFSTTQVKIWLYHNGGSNAQITVSLYDVNEATSYGSLNLPVRSVNTWDEATFTGLNLTQTQHNNLVVALSVSKNGGGKADFANVFALYADATYSDTAPSPPSFQQSGFRIFNSINSTNVGSPLAGINSNAVLNAGGDAFRVRLLLHLSGSSVAPNDQLFKLQYVARGNGTCQSPSGGTPANYTDVTGSTLIAYSNLTSGVSDGDAITPNANDPNHSSHPLLYQSVEEANNFTNNQSGISVGEDAMWDFSLRDNNAPSATTYCLRAVHTDGSPIASYSEYPQITTGNGVLLADIVDAAGTPVAAPVFSFLSSGYRYICEPSTGQLGSASQNINVTNNTGTASWSITIAATAGNTALWSSGTDNFDYNDPSGTPAGCNDGADADTVAGQLTIDPSSGTLTPRAGCNNTGIALGSPSSFAQGVTDSITIANANSSAELSCSWGFTDIPLFQQVPADQVDGTYNINFTITATAV